MNRQFRYELADLGLNVTAQSTFDDLANHLSFLWRSDIKENTRYVYLMCDASTLLFAYRSHVGCKKKKQKFNGYYTFRVLLTKNSALDLLITLAGIIQLNAMHIGNNKNFSFLLHNAKSTKVYLYTYIYVLLSNYIIHVNASFLPLP